MSLRLFRIAWTVSRYRLDSLVPQERLPPVIRWLWRFAPVRLIPIGDHSRGKRLRLALESLGPIFVKFGQMLSTRRDLLPPDTCGVRIASQYLWPHLAPQYDDRLAGL